MLFYHSGMMPPMVNILYITGESHSGSTLLAMALGNHPGVFAPGEVKAFGRSYQRNYIRKYRPDLLHSPASAHAAVLWERPCTCGAAPLRTCPVWAATAEHLMRSLGRPIDDIDVDHHDPVRFAADNRALFQAIQAVTGATWIVDSSKSLQRLLRLRAVDGLNVKPLRLVRSPHGVVYSEYRRGRPLLRSAYVHVRNEWRRKRALRHVPHLEVHYEQLVHEPIATLGRCIAALGLPFDAQQLGRMNQPQHIFQGNRVRFTSVTTFEEDKRWQTNLSRAQKVTIALLMLPLRLG